MSTMLKLLALMALCLSLLSVPTDAEAGPCKRAGEMRNKKGDCVPLKTVQRRAPPPLAPLPAPAPVMVAPVLPPAPAPIPRVVAEVAPAPRSGFLPGISMPSTIPATYVQGQVVETCDGLLVVPGVFVPQQYSPTTDVRSFGYISSRP